jgi:hypothetical protein
LTLPFYYECARCKTPLRPKAEIGILFVWVGQLPADPGATRLRLRYSDRLIST